MTAGLVAIIADQLGTAPHAQDALLRRRILLHWAAKVARVATGSLGYSLTGERAASARRYFSGLCGDNEELPELVLDSLVAFRLGKRGADPWDSILKTIALWRPNAAPPIPVDKERMKKRIRRELAARAQMRLERRRRFHLQACLKREERSRWWARESEEFFRAWDRKAKERAWLPTTNAR